MAANGEGVERVFCRPSHNERYQPEGASNFLEAAS